MTVGPASWLDVDEVRAERAGWTGAGARARRVRVRGAAARARHGAAGRGASRGRRRHRPELAGPQRGVAAGQALVMYDGDTVLGSATITAARHVPVPC